MVNYRKILRLLDLGYTQRDIAKLFHPYLYGAALPHKEPDYAYMHTELARKGVNLTLLWSEYCAECYANGDNPYMYTQFCEKYRHSKANQLLCVIEQSLS